LTNEYLKSFLEDFSYDPSDAKALLTALEQIQQRPEACAALEEAMAQYAADPACDHGALIALADRAAQHSGVHEYTADLLLYILLSETLLERYREKGIADGIFHNTLLDLRYKLEECKAVKGVVGTFVAGWFAGFYEMTRFAFGRLQFEVIPFEAEYDRNGHHLTADSRVINIHIPRTGTPLDTEACEASYAQAAAFFADQIGGEPAFVCYSWLLYPENRAILPPHSRIRAFMERFDVFRSGISKDRADLWRLFDTDEQHPDRLPADTSVRRAYIEHLKNGGKLGWGYGVFFWGEGA